MEPTPLIPQDPSVEAKNTPAPQSGTSKGTLTSPSDAVPLPPTDTKKNPFDLGKILLPKKEAPGTTPASAQRINAGILLEQEQSATLKAEAPKGTLTSTQLDAVPVPPAPSTPASKEGAAQSGISVPLEKPLVQPIETYQSDIEDLVKDKNVSMLTIAAAEAERRGLQHTDTEAGTKKIAAWLNWSLLKNIALYGLGFLLLVAASGALAYIVERPTSVSTPQPIAAPFIAVDDTKVITILPDSQRGNVMSSLTAAKQATSLSLGLVSRLLVTVASTTSSGQTLLPVDAQSFFTLIAPNMPQNLLLTLRPAYLLGVHVYNDNQPFLILSVDSYEQAYAGMLAWEPYLQQDLSPLFNYTPTVHIPEQGVAASTPSPQFIQTGFVDKIVENHDARVIQNNTGDISLLWTFLDRNTLVITTNDATLREVISRLQQAPVTPIPSGQ